MSTANPDPRAYDLTTGKTETGILFVHGFTGSPTETRPFADYVHQVTGWRCKGVLLPGHGTRVEEMESTSGTDWLAEAERGYRELAGHHKHVFLAGVSMGAVLCCHVALKQIPDSRIRGLILMAPPFAIPRRDRVAVGILQYLQRLRYKGDKAAAYFRENRLFSYTRMPLRKVRDVLALGSRAVQEMDRLRAMPILIFCGSYDRTVSLDRIRALAAEKKWIRLVELPRSRHILTVEPDHQFMFEESVRFMKESLASLA